MKKIQNGEAGEDISKFWEQNGMHPSPIPPALQNLSWAEHMLIARAVPCTSVNKLEGNNLAYSGHVINMTQDITSLLKSFHIFLQTYQLSKSIGKEKWAPTKTSLSDKIIFAKH